MIQRALTICRAEWLASMMAVLAVGVVLFVPSALFTTSSVLEGVAMTYLEAYQPKVFFRADVELADIEKLTREVEEWSEVGSVRRLDPQANLDRLSARLGEAQVDELGITRSMMPEGIELVPAVPIVDHVDLTARVAGLEARQSVDAVQVPSPDVVRVMTAASGLLIVGWVMLVLAFLAAFLILRQYLFHLRQQEGDQDQVLEIFGATPQQLGTPTLVRGLAVGALGGVVAACGLLVLLTFVLGVVSAMLGETVSVGLVWLFAMLCPVLGGLLGGLAGLPIARTSSLSTVVAPAGLQLYFGV